MSWQMTDYSNGMPAICDATATSVLFHANAPCAAARDLSRHRVPVQAQQDRPTHFDTCFSMDGRNATYLHCRSPGCLVPPAAVQ